jgi:TRAP-type uncharacterized transport system substrate-binding protein
MAKVLDDGDKLRVLPVITYGALGNVKDLLGLKGIDVAFTQADVFAELKKDPQYGDIDKRVNYIAPMYLSEVHIYARPEIKNIEDLKDRVVNFNTTGSAANVTGQIVFDRLQIPVRKTFINNAVAFEKMKSGEIAALVHVVGKPNDLFAKMKLEPGFHFISVPYNEAFKDFYAPTIISSADYPNLIPEGDRVDTIAVHNVLAVFNWPRASERGRRIARFVEYLFKNFELFRQPGFHPKWKEINLAAAVPGWTRYPVAEETIAALRGPGPGRDVLKSELDEYLRQRDPMLGLSEREALIEQFLAWRRQRQSDGPATTGSVPARKQVGGGQTGR